jgi:glycine oxidase
VSSADVAVVGAGVVGLATAWRLAQRGLAVRVYDPAPGSGASTVAAGMLAPVGEAHFGEEALLGLLLASARAWPAFAAEVEAASGADLGYRTDGTLAAAFDADGLAEIERVVAYQRSLGLAVEPLRGSACRALEPLLGPRVRGGALAAGDHQVDPRRLVAALRSIVDGAGVAVTPVAVRDLAALDAEVVVVAAGCRSGELAGLPVRPVKGQLLRLRATAGAPRFDRVIRGSAAGRSVYLVPRADGEVVVGATSEERGFDRTVTAGAVHDLLSAALDVLPALAEYELAEACAGSRPGTPDNAPLLGRTADPRVVAATGHHRNGILLTPVTADAIAELVGTGRPPDGIVPFSPLRFEGVTR